MDTRAQSTKKIVQCRERRGPGEYECSLQSTFRIHLWEKDVIFTFLTILGVPIQ